METKPSLPKFIALLCEQSEKRYFRGIMDSGLLNNARSDNKEKKKSKTLTGRKKIESKTYIFRNLNLNKLKLVTDSQDLLREDATLELKVSLSEIQNSSYEVYDIFEEYSVQIIIIAKSSSGGTYKTAWHFDKHIRTTGDNKSEFIHPEYHLNMGGFAITKNDDFKSYGQFLLIDAPRVMYPPLNSILAIDFVLQQFYGSRVKELLDNNIYKNYILESQKQLWKPYFTALASHWGNPQRKTIQPDYSAKILGEK